MMADKLVEAIANMEEKEALALAKAELDSETPPMELLNRCREAMEIIGKRFVNGEYFIPELLMGGEILKQIQAVAKPRISTTSSREKKLGRVVFGTVANDIHDLGKDIVEFMLDINGFEVHDLGVDVPPEKFVEAIKRVKPQIVGMSCLLTVAFESMKNTVDAIKAAGLRDGVKIMIGGGTTDEQVKAYVGADAYGKDAVAAVALAKKWIGGNQDG
jgi:5-methyltetrahydrofolate--homocysteine methyltransferase